MKTVKVKWVKEHANEINLIDVRSPGEYAQGHIEGAKNIPTPGIIFNADHLLDKEKEYHIICHSGQRSGATCAQLEDKGFKVVDVLGGMSAL